MARSHGRILTTIWEDEDFLALTEQQQRLYLFLISQPNLNHAGLLPITLRRWARKAAGLTAGELEQRLHELADARFVVLDDDTEELLIRSFVRNDGVWKQPKVMGAMVSGAMEIESRPLRRALLEEMDRVPLDELSDDPTKYRGQDGPSIRRQVQHHIETLREEFGTPSPDPFGGGCEPPSEPPSASPSPTPCEPPSDTPAEGGQEGSTRAVRARVLRADAGARTARVSPAPAPAPAPTPTTSGGQAPGAVTAQTLISEWLDRVPKRPPGKVIGQASREIKQLLAEGINPDDIRRGMARWMTKGLHPSTIPSVVNEVMNAAPRPPDPSGTVVAFPTGQQLTGTDARVAGWGALAAQLEARGGQP